FLKEKNELYIKYNSCREDGETPLKEKIERSIEFIEKNKVEKIIIDIRNNLGGDSTLINPLLKYIKNNKSINKRENFKIIIGRETFSSALLNAYEFKRETNAFIIGEPSGGKPNCYGEILKFTLPNSKFIVSYSTKYYELIEDDEVMALYPDKLILESIEDYKNNLVEIQNEY
ncbi:S41 family peptidase, partial [Clostridium sp.]|uniref:S41 family peptidase n=1 Tax=Clostridium sp. TaxID=1506 RepID=UPI003F31D107